jgi:NADPH:quinone reductase-like Zn-dependent oxidoreductase
MSKAMRAVRLVAPGGPEELVLEDVPVPEPRPGDAIVRVGAAAITRDELSWPVDRLPATPSHEVCGTVVALGTEASGLAVGDEVYGLTAFDRDGCAAEYAAVSSALLAPRPAGLEAVEAAAIPMGALSAWQGLFDHGSLQPGQRVLVTGARGGVGQFAVQFARTRGARVVEEGPGPVDLVFDTAGGETLKRASELVRPGGKLVSVAEDPADGIYFIVEPSGEQLVEIARLVDEGAIRVEIDSVYPLVEARAAFERVAERGKHGKVVLEVA